jgi:short-subunit dehydrogenase
VPTYGIAKWGLRGFALNLRHELRDDGIGVTFLSPGGTLTDMWAGEDLPPNRLLEPTDVALMVAAITELSSQAVVDEIVLRPMLGDIHE